MNKILIAFVILSIFMIGLVSAINCNEVPLVKNAYTMTTLNPYSSIISNKSFLFNGYDDYGFGAWHTFANPTNGKINLNNIIFRDTNTGIDYTYQQALGNKMIFSTQIVTYNITECKGDGCWDNCMYGCYMNLNDSRNDYIKPFETVYFNFGKNTTLILPNFNGPVDQNISLNQIFVTNGTSVFSFDKAPIDPANWWVQRSIIFWDDFAGYQIIDPVDQAIPGDPTSLSIYKGFGVFALRDGLTLTNCNQSEWTQYKSQGLKAKSIIKSKAATLKR